jgi:uncharacterized membrane protein YcjF (UPF0283 family)
MISVANALRFVGVLLLCTSVVLGIQIRRIATTIVVRVCLFFLSLAIGAMGLSFLLWGDQWYPIILYAVIVLPVAFLGSVIYVLNEWITLMLLRKSQEITRKLKSNDHPQVEKYDREIAQSLERGFANPRKHRNK